MIGLRSLRNRLAVAFGLIVLGAIGTIYLTVTPRLEERLQDQKLDRLQEDARRSAAGGFIASCNPACRRPAWTPLEPFAQEAAAGAVERRGARADRLAPSRRRSRGSSTRQPEGGLRRATSATSRWRR